MFLVYNWSILSILFGARLFAITINGYVYEKLLIDGFHPITSMRGRMLELTT